MLVMTATPIPRTLALTTYGDLDVSSIRELPPGRTPVRTIGQAGRRVAMRSTRSADRARRRPQAYVVYPIIEESEKTDLRAATEMADHLAQDVFPAYRVALLHGRMKQDAKDRVMRAFAAGEIHILVVDHRRSRSASTCRTRPSWSSSTPSGSASRSCTSCAAASGGAVSSPRCILLYQYPITEEARERLKMMTETTDGFVIAEKDLELRGPATSSAPDRPVRRRSGSAISVRDHLLMEEARREARAWLDAGASDTSGSTSSDGRGDSGWAHRRRLRRVGPPVSRTSGERRGPRASRACSVRTVASQPDPAVSCRL